MATAASELVDGNITLGSRGDDKDKYASGFNVSLTSDSCIKHLIFDPLKFYVYKITFLQISISSPILAAKSTNPLATDEPPNHTTWTITKREHHPRIIPEDIKSRHMFSTVLVAVPFYENIQEI